MSESKKSAEQIEQERVTRRQALRRLGFGAGLSALMLLTADDLARMVGDRLRQMEGDSKVAEQVAKELQDTGLAMANYGIGPVVLNCSAWGVNCTSCCQTVYSVCTYYGYDYQTCTAAQLVCNRSCPLP